ncbi:alpha/beta hydrolase [Kitasatospora sp. NPDC048540]|uniref:alpha/beta hydrolase n=1 Tax=Kitasatospora sp. NPDC048540 TaxID=3155634 RepID=UPI0034086757
MTHVVLVHGLWVDGSSWEPVTIGLQEAGHEVTAVQLPLSSLADDIATVRRALAQIQGPVVLAGHSYGGMVITGAASGSSDVVGLVYVAAVAPDEGEAAGEILGRFAPSDGLQNVEADAEGYATLKREVFPELFAGDVPLTKARAMAAAQGPAAPACLSTPSGPPAWKSLPSTYVFCERDRTVAPEAQKWMAERIGADVVVAQASHAVAVSQPSVVVDAILSRISAA